MIRKEYVEEFQLLTKQLEEKLTELQKLDMVLKNLINKDSDDARKYNILENEYKRVTSEIKEIRLKAETLKKKI